MIQRIQSLWLFITFGLMASASTIPYMIHYNSLYLHIGLVFATITPTFLAFLNIFSYKDRQKQTFVCWVTLVLILICCWILYRVGILGYYKNFNPKPWMQFSIFCSPIAIVFNLLALWGIRKDEKLIRSADRLR